MQAFSTVVQVAEWAGFDAATIANANTVGGSLLYTLGLETTDPPRVIGIIPESDMESALGTWRVPRRNPDGTAMDPPQRAPTLAELGRAKVFARACRLHAGNGPSSIWYQEGEAEHGHLAGGRHGD